MVAFLDSIVGWKGRVKKVTVTYKQIRVFCVFSLPCLVFTARSGGALN